MESLLSNCGSSNRQQAPAGAAWFLVSSPALEELPRRHHTNHQYYGGQHREQNDSITEDFDEHGTTAGKKAPVK